MPALEVRNLEFSPGWAVGWWFVPFANLVKPYQVMRELWNSSNADFDPRSFLSRQTGDSSIIGWWWGLWIVGAIFGRISDKVGDAGSNYFPITLMIYCVLHGTAALLLISIIKRITNEQDLRFQKLSSLNNFSIPPPPPEF